MLDNNSYTISTNSVIDALYNIYIYIYINICYRN